MNRLQQNMRQQAEWMAKTNNYQCEMGFAAQVKIGERSWRNLF